MICYALYYFEPMMAMRLLIIHLWQADLSFRYDWGFANNNSHLPAVGVNLLIWYIRWAITGGKYQCMKLFIYGLFIVNGQFKTMKRRLDFDATMALMTNNCYDDFVITAIAYCGLASAVTRLSWLLHICVGDTFYMTLATSTISNMKLWRAYPSRPMVWPGF